MTERIPQTLTTMAQGEMAKNPLLEIAPLPTLAVHIIAANRPSDIKFASATATLEYRQAAHNAALGQAMSADAQEYVNEITSIRRNRADTIAQRAQDEARSTQDRVEMWESIGFAPTADNLADSFRNLDRVEQANEDQQAVRDGTDPEIVAAQEGLFENLLASGTAQLKATEMQGEFDLSTVVNNEVQRLGKKGRIKARVAGAVLGITAGLSTLFALHHSEPSPVNSAPEHSILENERFIGAALGATTLLGLAGGAAAASAGNGHFARQAARREVRQYTSL